MPSRLLLLQVNIPGDIQCRVMVEDQMYQLLQVHYHAPSEHTFNGVHTLMEAHLVHKNVKTGGEVLVWHRTVM